MTVIFEMRLESRVGPQREYDGNIVHPKSARSGSWQGRRTILREISLKMKMSRDAEHALSHFNGERLCGERVTI